MKKIFLSAFLIVSTGLYSQELDEAYLASLPESVRADVLDRIADTEEKDNPVYRRPSSMIKKPSSNSNRFGAQIFDMMQTSFMPINEPNFDSSYVLDFGDTLEIQLVGQQNSIEELSIKRDGSINISEIGKVSVAGLTLESASTLIKNKITNAYIGIEAFVTLVNIRDIQVLITGNAYNPGIYTLNGNSNLLHALSMAGGVNDNGSYRRIDLIRNDEVINTIDLYDIFIDGKSGFGDRLRSGDTILVRSLIKMVRLSGAVKRPGLYELKEGDNFSDLLKFGLGFADNADLQSLRVERPTGEITSFIEIPDLKKIKSIEVQSSDNLNIRAFERRSVLITGAVKRPGSYTIARGETLSSLIKKADGYEDNAYPFGGVLNNIKALQLNNIAKEKLYTTFVQKLITKGDQLFASESLPFVLAELKRSEVTGRVMAEFDLDVIEANPNLDTTLDDGDKIIIPIKAEQVYIFGEINQIGAVRYKPSKDIDYYISSVGGLLESSDKKNIFVAHPNGEINKLNNVNRFSLLNNKSNDILIYPGSVIYVPREVKSQDASIVASIWAPIVSSTATSITALSVLNKQ
ncbi:SLBB domain-containing protein [Gammaproteobacteria bacterium]|nr:SLBB domain-containing protein [Gammaproteobacteria bacterium]